MITLLKTVAAVAVGTVLATSAFAQSAREIRGASPCDPPWWWADASDNNTIDIANLPPGKHKVRLQLVNSDHEVFPGQEVTHTFTIPARQASSGGH